MSTVATRVCIFNVLLSFFREYYFSDENLQKDFFLRRQVRLLYATVSLHCSCTGVRVAFFWGGGGGGEGKVGGKELLKCMARYKSVFNNLWWFDLKLGGKSLCPCACIYISAFSPTRSRGTRTPTCSLIKIASLVF